MASVLLVEDDADVRTALIRELSVRSHVVRSVGTAMDALREVTRPRPTWSSSTPACPTSTAPRC